MGSNETGRKGESLAAKYLVQKGWTIKDINFKTRAGEVDIIAERNSVFGFIEVKFRNYESDYDAINSLKVRKFYACSQQYLYKKGVDDESLLEFYLIFIKPSTKANKFLVKMTLFEV